MTASEIKALITLLWSKVGSDLISSGDLRTVGNALVDFAKGNTTTIDEWDSGTTYNTTTTKYAEDNNRIWKSKLDGNLNNEPPQDPEITEDTWWIEVSQGKNMEDWSPGLYGDGLVLVFYADSIYKLENATRPYESTNIQTEAAAGDWKDIINGPLIKTADNAVNMVDPPCTYIFHAGEAVSAVLPEGRFEIVNKPIRFFSETDTPVSFDGDGTDPIEYADPWEIGADIAGEALWDGTKWKFK